MPNEILFVDVVQFLSPNEPSTNIELLNDFFSVKSVFHKHKWLNFGLYNPFSFTHLFHQTKFPEYL